MLERRARRKCAACAVQILSTDSLNAVAACVARFRVLVCGGDGTVAWALSMIDELCLLQQCSVGVLPLGTGNDLSRVLNTGGSFSVRRQLLTDIVSVVAGTRRPSLDTTIDMTGTADAKKLTIHQLLMRYQDADERLLDRSVRNFQIKNELNK
jgi:hypothetical protein